MSSEQVRKKFLDFFEKKEHTIVPPSSLYSDDPSVLITTAGMQQFKPYYTGEKDPLKDIHPNLGRPLDSKNTASIQKSFRTSDIDEVGDETHLTFFEMLGNFSFGGYFKDKAIEYGYEFITSKDWMNLEIDKVTVFDPKKVPADDWRKDVPFDQDSYKIWQKIFKDRGILENLVFSEGVDNFWGPTGNEGPCGPTTEIYVKNSKGDSVEIWNIVFNEYYCDPEKQLTKLPIPGVDTGMGLERLMMVIQNKPTIFDTDLFTPISNSIIAITGDKPVEKVRVIADHLRASTFLIADGIRPSNKEAGYILRRLIRRAMLYHYKYIGAGLDTKFYLSPTKEIIRIYSKVPDYINLHKEEPVILEILQQEADRFSKTLENGLKEFQKLISREEGKTKFAVRWPPKDLQKKSTYTINAISPGEAFDLYQNYGFPLELINELLAEHALFIDKEEFDKEFAKHQEKSRAGAEAKFGGHGLLLDTGEIKAGSEEESKKVLRLHTTTHLLQAALRKVLGNEVEQRGSDVNAQRTRFDFTFPRKMTPEEIKKVEDLINEAIKKDLPVRMVEMSLEEAKKTGALHFFKAKYPSQVKVYYVGDSMEDAFSKEFCNGPHVESTGEIGQVVIKKEESVSAGIRRIRAEII